MVRKTVLLQINTVEVEDRFFQFSWLKCHIKVIGSSNHLIARPYTTAQFYSGHSPDDGGEMWPIFLVFADIANAH